MSTVLELCQDAARECGITGDGPTTTVGQIGELRDVIRWLRNGYNELQLRHGGQLRFLRHDFTVPTVQSQQAYAYTAATDVQSAATIDRFGRWFIDQPANQPRCYLTADGVSGEYWMNYLNYEDFSSLYLLGTQAEGTPVHITVDPRDNILVGPLPNAAFTISGEYYRSPELIVDTGLAADDTVVPEIPVQFHQLLVYRAMEKYAGYNSAPEMMVRIATEYRRIERDFENHQAPRTIRLGRPLA